MVSKKEFKKAWLDLGGTPTEEGIDSLFELIDKDGNGSIDYNEFHAAIHSIKVPLGIGYRPKDDLEMQTDLDSEGMDALAKQVEELKAERDEWQAEAERMELRAKAAEETLATLEAEIAEQEAGKARQQERVF